MNIAQLRQRYETAKQGHLFKRWHQLSEPEREALAEQLINLDIERVNRIYLTAIDAEKDAADSSKAERIDPLPVDLSDTTLNPSKVKEWEGIGMKAIANGEVAVLLMAGGQGTRLGSSAPKGCYDIGLPSHKSLFQYQAERILCLQRLAASREGKRAGSVIIPWYVMTSGPTRSDTEDFFKENKFFGLDPANVIFFEQGEKRSSSVGNRCSPTIQGCSHAYPWTASFS
jgi:UDP-N-acetylglucosamine/UDP-N-acetylgalactosamine diphosphorylase